MVVDVNGNGKYDRKWMVKKEEREREREREREI
jgi:hypothetical protein